MTQHKVLAVDDEQNILSSLERLFFDEERFDFLTSSDPLEGLEIIKSSEISLVISDYRMPGMTGVEMLRRARELSPSTMRIMLTGYADINAAIDAINLGEVHRFLTKPWNAAEVKGAVHHALDHLDLLAENRRLQELTARQNEELKQLNQDLEERVEERTRQLQEKNLELADLYKSVRNSFVNSIKIFSGMVETYDRTLGGHSKRVARFSLLMGKKLGLNPDYVEYIEIAAQLHDIGLIGIPKEIINKPEQRLTPGERTLIRQHPEIGQTIVNFGDRFDKIGKLIRSHHERYDGKGFPDGLAEQEIPIGARIIAIANYYDRTMGREITETRYDLAVDQLRGLRAKAFDPELVDLFIDILTERTEIQAEEKAVSISDLQIGMVLARDVVSKDNWLLLSAGTVLNQVYIERLENWSKIVPMQKHVFVYQVN